MPGWKYEIRLWWENFQDQFEPPIVLAEPQEKGNPCQKPYVFNDNNDWFTHKLLSWQVALACWAGKPDIHYLEVGFYEGRAALWMPENVQST